MLVKKSESIATIAKALAAAQTAMKNPEKNSFNPHFRSKYANLADVRDAVMAHLGKQGLSLVQLPTELDDGPALTSILMHESGEWIETTLKLRATKNDPQSVGSALTYARRYALQSIAGVAAEDDDDGNAGSTPESDRPQANPKQPGTAPQQTPPDRDLVDKFMKRYDGCRVKREVTAIGLEIKAVASQLTDAGKTHLRKYAASLLEKLPEDLPSEPATRTNTTPPPAANPAAAANSEIPF